ncbi:YhgE/Pip domain-containing protein [Paenibacillus arenilitoris]|uniref:ABC transporter permease n=1 Tax=Paenibacillus arenilitoris TaxID=2772299 RepID=A0A927H7T6_9BACL|nr:ABC transporter permease [Paenibacillus arenilitoris]MBD2870993.1 ABC transporter permease [Paenibacillus arenilitoris]
MKNALQAFMKRPTTWIGIVTALMFQIVFSAIWMTGYDGVTERVGELRIAVVNEDEQMGRQVASGLVQNLPFDMREESSLEAAKKRLNERELQMVVYIPGDFSMKATAADGTASIQYLINESNPALIKSIMTGAAAQITAEVNRQAVAGGVQTVLGGLHMPADQAAAASRGLSERVTSDIRSTNVVDGMNNQMVPMMMVLASYVGAMIMGMNFEQSALAVGQAAGKWQRFAARSVMNIGAAIVVSLVGSTLLASFGGQMAQGFLHLWLFQLLFLLTFVFVSQMFLYLFGMGGMLFNIMALSAQLVSSGAIVPRELLSDFYIALGDMLPATYAVEGNMNLLFGGPSPSSDALALGVIAAVAVAISVFAVAAKRQAPRSQPVAAIASQHGK